MDTFDLPPRKGRQYILELLPGRAPIIALLDVPQCRS